MSVTSQASQADLTEILGEDLAALVRAREVVLTKCTEITALPSPVRSRAAFYLEFADGARLKGRRLQSPEQAEVVDRIRRRIGEGFSRILQRRGDALLLEWVEGPTLTSLEPIPPKLLRRCGGMLGALHQLPCDRSEGDPVPSPGDFLDKLELNASLLCGAHRLDTRLARRARDAAAAACPAEMALGIIHKDFCAANLVLGPGAVPICIDNAKLTFGPLDLDLARTWYRWPMIRRDLAHFADGYAEHRSLATFLADFPFWAICVLVGSAAWRLRSRVPGGLEPIERLGALLDHSTPPVTEADHPFWGA